jgi:hypothetical protein
MMLMSISVMAGWSRIRIQAGARLCLRRLLEGLLPVMRDITKTRTTPSGRAGPEAHERRNRPQCTLHVVSAISSTEDECRQDDK